MYSSIVFSMDDLDCCSVCCNISKYGKVRANNKVSDYKLSGLDCSIWWEVCTLSSTEISSHSYIKFGGKIASAYKKNTNKPFGSMLFRLLS